MANAALSASCAFCTKPTWRARLAIGSGSVSFTLASHRTTGTSPIVSKPHTTIRAAVGDDAAPDGSRTLVPSTATSAPDDTAALTTDAVTSACSGCTAAASCRAVGWSNTSVLGSESAPAMLCSWLRSSTAP
eukprot:5435581-Prymnesium_polylepis.1